MIGPAGLVAFPVLQCTPALVGSVAGQPARTGRRLMPLRRFSQEGTHGAGVPSYATLAAAGKNACATTSSARAAWGPFGG